MTPKDAHGNLQRILNPMPLDGFLDGVLGRRFIKVPADAQNHRAELLGPDPERVILAAFGDIAPHMAFHAVEPRGPAPSVGPVASAQAFEAKVAAFHALGYTVRLPQPRWLSPPLEAFLRALEFMLHTPAKAEAFWSRGDAKAPVHHDDFDIIVIQLKGRKRWFIGSDLPDLPNAWTSVLRPHTILGKHDVVEVGPGDLLYLPRGTPHRVDALTDSLHLSISFTPLTLREAIIATLDHLSDLDRPFRQTVGQRLAQSIGSGDFNALPGEVRKGVARLAALCQSEGFVAEALQLRSARAISNLSALSRQQGQPEISRNSLVRQAPMAMCHLVASEDMLEFNYPGGRIYIHKGAEPGVRFITNTFEFKIGDIPGDIGDDVRLALANRFLDCGFLYAVRQ
jgi:mannose-6-phosphate isomerase-like protein (cupin superfamily)